MGAKPAWPPRVPADLAEAGKKLWRAIIADAQDVGIVLNAVELAQLKAACAIEGRIATLEAELVAQEIGSTGSTGQAVLNPLIAEIRMQTQLKSQTLGRLTLDLPAEKTPKTPAAGGTNRFAAAALARWGAGGG
ncbi:hypothetical protein [Mycobacterium sp. URHD0025]|uniref:hypothetical protein n=1 Tax=Mycobacterium sp. URHD0025 TaxID=1298864 RepID=UPI00049013C5|nr:hypothetical protein [Mycobacterium sp. URHD0025]